MQQIQSEEHFLRGRRRIARTAFFIAFVAIGALIWSSATAFNLPVTFERAYDPYLPVAIDVSACDVTFTPGDAPTMQYHALAKLAPLDAPSWVDHPTDPTMAQGASFVNTAASGCETIPLGDCSRLCHVTITVPADGAAAFSVYQPSNDVAKAPKLIVEDGVTIASLSVGSWWAVAPSLSLHVGAASIGSVSTVLGSGNAKLVGTTAGTINLRAETGSVYALDLAAQQSSVELNVRQPSNRYCVASDASDVTYAVADAAEGINCDLSAVASGSSTDGFAMYSMTQSHFDKDSNGRVTKSEFTSAMLGFTCCGK